MTHASTVDLFTVTLDADDLARLLRALDRADPRSADEAKHMRALRVRLADVLVADARQCRELGQHVGATRHARSACPLDAHWPR